MMNSHSPQFLSRILIKDDEWKIKTVSLLSQKLKQKKLGQDDL